MGCLRSVPPPIPQTPPTWRLSGHLTESACAQELPFSLPASSCQDNPLPPARLRPPCYWLRGRNVRLTSVRGATGPGGHRKPRFPHARAGGRGNRGCWQSGRRSKAPSGAAAGVRVAAGATRGRNESPEPGAGIPRRRPSLRAEPLPRWPVARAAAPRCEGPGDAGSRERARNLPGRTLAPNSLRLS